MDTGSGTVIVLLAIAVTATVLGFFALDTLRNNPRDLRGDRGDRLLAIVLDLVSTWARARGASAAPDLRDVVGS